MHITRTRCLITLCTPLAFAVGGCSSIVGQPPMVSISDPAVYTSLHLCAAKGHMSERYRIEEPTKYTSDGYFEQRNDANGVRSASIDSRRTERTWQKNDADSSSFPVVDDMARYFRQSPDEYEKNHLRMDAMLDDSQRITDALQVYESIMRVGLQYSPLGLQGAVEPPATGLLSSSAFASSPKTRAALMVAEDAQKDVKKKNAELQKAEDALAKAENEHKKASDSENNLNDEYEKAQHKEVRLRAESEQIQLEVDRLQGEVEAPQTELKGIQSEKDPDPNELNSLENKIPGLKKEIEAEKKKKSQVDRELGEVQEKVGHLKIDVDRQKSDKNVEKAKNAVEKAEGDVKTAKGALSQAEETAKTEQNKAMRTVAEEEPNNPLATLRPKLVDLVADSPFDRMDRANDFYNAYLLKSLRSFGDSRAIQPYLDGMEANDIEKKLFDEFDVVDIEAPNPPRLLLVAFQVHVHPGTRPNYMVGLRLKVTGGKREGGATICPNDVKIMQLHPTRAYDIDDQLFLERINTALGASLSGSLPQNTASAALEWEERKKSEVRRNFLSRISKIASFSDAGRNEFGWDFYPSNLTVERKGPGQSLNGLVNGSSKSKYVVNAYLEGGARDCSAYMLVPYNVTEIELTAHYIIKSVAHGELNLPERRYRISEKGLRERITWLKRPSRMSRIGRKLIGWCISPDDKTIDQDSDNVAHVTIPLPTVEPDKRKFEIAAASLVLSRPHK